MDNVIALNDFFNFTKQRASFILKGASFLASLFCIYTLTRPVLFQAESTFREKKSSSESESQVALKWLSMGDEVSSNEAISWFKSHSARQALVKKFDLHAEIRGIRWWSFPTLRKIKEHLVADWARFWNKQSPSLPRRVESVFAKDVIFKGDSPLHLTIFLDSKEVYSVFCGKKCLGKGRFLEPFATETFRFTLVKERDDLKKYSLTLWPIETLASQLKGAISAKSSSKDASLVSLTLSSEDRFFARDYLNGLMDLYRDHLKNSHLKVISAQVAYLNKRQEEMNETLDHSLLEHVLSATQDLAHSGFVNSEKAFAFLAEGVQKQKEKLIALDLEIKRLKEFQNGSLNPFEGENFAPLLSELRSLKQREESLKLSLGSEIQETLLKEYRGLTLATSQEFYLSLCRDLKELKSREKLVVHALAEMASENFELSALSAVFHDPIFQKLIERASQIRQALSDEGIRTSGELIRLEKERQQVKGLLKSHLEQALSLVALEEGEVLKKIEEVTQVSLFLTNEQIFLLEKQLHKAIEVQMAQLEQERRLLLNQTISLNHDLERVPSQWLSEKKLERHLLSNEKITGELSRLVEAKNMSSHLDVVTAGPEDFAIAPLHPRSAHLILFPLFGAFLGGGIALGALFMQASCGKVPIGEETLLLKGMKVVSVDDLFFQLVPPPKRLLFLSKEHPNCVESLSKKFNAIFVNTEIISIASNDVPEIILERSCPVCDLALFVLEAPLNSPEALALAKHFESVVIELQEETTQDLMPYFLMGKKFIFIYSTKRRSSC